CSPRKSIINDHSTRQIRRSMMSEPLYNLSSFFKTVCEERKYADHVDFSVCSRHALRLLCICSDIGWYQRSSHGLERSACARSRNRCHEPRHWRDEADPDERDGRIRGSTVAAGPLHNLRP